MATGQIITLVAATANSLDLNQQREERGYLVLTNNTGAVLFLGGPNVSATVYGAQVAAAGQLVFQLAPRDTLYAFSTAGGPVAVLSSP